MKITKNILAVFAVAFLIGYKFFMVEGNRAITYGYAIIELLSIIILIAYGNWKLKAAKEFFIVFFLELYIFILTFLENAITYSYLCLFVGEVFLCLFIVSNIKEKNIEIISIFCNAMNILFIIDVISVVIALILHKHSNDSFGIVGHKNYHAFFFILTIGFIALDKHVQRKKIFDLSTIIICSIAEIIEIIVHSASGSVAVLLLVFLLYFSNIRKIKFYKLNIIIMMLLVINLVLVLGFSNQGIIQFIRLLGRDSGLTGRAAIWAKTFELIYKRYFYGYGFYKTIHIYFVDLGWINNHCHNFWLNLIVSGGAIYAFLILFLIFKIAKIVDKDQSIINYIFTSVVGCYLLLGVSEIIVNVNAMLFPLLLFCYYSQIFNERYSQDNLVYSQDGN